MTEAALVIAAWKSAIHATASRLASRSLPVPSARVRLALPVWGGGRYGRSSGGTTIRTGIRFTDGIEVIGNSTEPQAQAAA